MKRSIRPLLLAVAATAALGLAACSSAAPSVVGTWGEAESQGEPSLTFEEDGSYSGSDGCNRVMGSWEADGSTVDLGMMATTLMYCEGVDTWLSQGATAEIDGTTLIVLDQGGEQLGSLERSSD